MSFPYLLLSLAGLALVAWGLPASHRLGRPFDSLAALGAITGLIAALLGAMLTVVPGFFRG